MMSEKGKEIKLLPQNEWSADLQVLECSECELAYILYIKIGTFTNANLYKSYEIEVYNDEQAKEYGYDSAFIGISDHSEYCLDIESASGIWNDTELQKQLWTINDNTDNKELDELWQSLEADHRAFDDRSLQDLLLPLLEKELLKQSAEKFEKYKAAKDTILAEDRQTEYDDLQ